MAGHGSKYPRKRHQAIIALLTQPTMAEAAKAVGVTEKTLLRWWQRPDFRESYREAKTRVVQHAMSRLQQASGQAVDALLEIVSNIQNPPSTRVTAAKAILEQAVKAVEWEDLLARLETLEEAVFRR